MYNKEFIMQNTFNIASSYNIILKFSRFLLHISSFFVIPWISALVFSNVLENIRFLFSLECCNQKREISICENRDGLSLCLV